MPKLDLFLMQDVPYSDFVEMAQLADKHGFENLWLIDSQDVYPDVWTTTALCAVSTSRIRLGPGVTNPLTRHPRVTANAMITVHELSKGRGILGIGAGDSAVRTLGWTPAKVPVVRESVEICRAEFKAKGVEIPIYVAVTGPKMIAYACRDADGIIASGGGTPEEILRVLERIETAAKEIGRDPRTIPVLYMFGFAISDNKREAFDDVRGPTTRMLKNRVLDYPQYWPPELEHLRELAQRTAVGYDYKHHLKSHVPHAEAVSDALVEAFAIAGTPREVLPKFKRCWQAVADRNFTFYLRPEGKGKKRSFERFVREILPELK